MAITLNTSSIATGQTIEAGHVTQSAVALTGGEAYDITISGSLNINNAPITNLTASGNISGSGFIKVNNGVFNAGGISINSKTIDYVAPNLRVKNTGLIIFGGPLTGSIISASGDLKAGKLLIDEKAAIDTYTSTVDELTLNPDGTWGAIRLNRDGNPKPIILEGAVTASSHISGSDIFARDITANDITLDAIGVSDKPNVTLKRGSTTGISLQMGSGGNDNGLFIINNALGLQDIRLEGLGHSFFSQSLNVGVPYSYPEPVGGTFTVRGTISSSGAINTLSHITASANISASGDVIGGGLNIEGVSRISSSNSSIVSVLTENDSHPFITGVTTTGPNFRMNLADADSSGSAYMAFGRQTGNFGGTGFTAQYATGSNASEGEIVMSIGKNGQLGQIQDRFIVQSEPGPIGSNTFSELSLLAGTHTDNRRVVQMVVQNGTSDFADVTVGNQNTATGFKKHVLMTHALGTSSSIAGFASSSMNTGSTARNFNANSIPFGIVAGGPTSADLVDTVFFIDRGGTFGRSTPITASLEISRGGSINMEGSITASGAGLFQAGKPIKTHTANLTASLANAGFYHIVGGTLTCSISISSAPIGAEYEFFQTQSGNFLFKSGSGISLISKNGSLRLAQLGSSAVLKKVGTSTYHLMGDLT